MTLDPASQAAYQAALLVERGLANLPAPVESADRAAVVAEMEAIVRELYRRSGKMPDRGTE